MTNDLPSVGTEDARPVCNDAHQHMALVTLYALALTTGGPMGAVDQFKAIRDHVAALVSERDELASRVRELEAEVLDQCRLNGMGAERESALMGRVRELESAALAAQPGSVGEREAFQEGYEAAQADAKVCELPPFGWSCTRTRGHEGPCAAVESPDDAKLVADGMKRLREAKPAQPCGHQESLLLKSAETGEPLYCEACDDKSGRRDAEQRETELLAANQALREKIAALSKPAQDAVGAALAYLDDLKDDAAAHIFPDDLERCMTSECEVQVASVRMGSPDGMTVPLFSRDQVADAIRAAISAKKGQP